MQNVESVHFSQIANISDLHKVQSSPHRFFCWTGCINIIGWLNIQGPYVKSMVVLEQVKSCASVSCLINTEPLELLHLQPSEPIASEIVIYSLAQHSRARCKVYGGSRTS